MRENFFSRARDFIWLTLLTVFYLISSVFVFFYSLLVDVFKKK